MSAHGEAVKPPLLVPVLRDRLSGDLCDGHPLGLRPGEDRFHDVGREVVQDNPAGYNRGCFEVNFDLSTMKKRTGDGKRTP